MCFFCSLSYIAGGGGGGGGGGVGAHIAGVVSGY